MPSLSATRFELPNSRSADRHSRSCSESVTSFNPGIVCIRAFHLLNSISGATSPINPDNRVGQERGASEIMWKMMGLALPLFMALAGGAAFAEERIHADATIAV